MKPEKLPIEHLRRADEVMEYVEAEDAPDWSKRHPYIPVDTGGILRAKRADKWIKRSWRAPKAINVVETDAWWLNAEHTMLAIRCSWKVKAAPVWWGKNGSQVWYYEKVHGVWEKRKLSDKSVKALIGAYKTLSAFDW
jgi:hypothetical protein